MAAGSAVAMIGANLRFGSSAANASLNATRVFQCHPGGTAEATLIFALGSMGMAANLALMGVILANRQLRRWSQGLLFHQGIVDCARAALLLPLGMSILHCQPVNKCSLVETAFLLLVTVATVNMLTTVLNDSPVFPEDENDTDITDAPLLMDSPQCVLFGTFMIWFASITINLGPTFLSGALAAQGEPGHRAPSCPLIHGPLRHYILNALWIAVNLVCVVLTLFHLRKLHRDLTKANVEAVRVAGLVTTLVNVTGGAPRSSAPGTPNANGQRTTGALEEHRKMREYLNRMERDGVQRVKMFLVITGAYVLFWGPLFFVTLVNHPIIGNQLGHEITLHISYVHAIVNPTLFLTLHRGLRRAVLDLCCGWLPLWCGTPNVPPPPQPPREHISVFKTPLPTPAQPDSSMGDADMNGEPPCWSPCRTPLNGGVRILSHPKLEPLAMPDDDEPPPPPRPPSRPASGPPSRTPSAPPSRTSSAPRLAFAAGPPQPDANDLLHHQQQLLEQQHQQLLAHQQHQQLMMQQQLKQQQQLLAQQQFLEQQHLIQQQQAMEAELKQRQAEQLRQQQLMQAEQLRQQHKLLQSPKQEQQVQTNFSDTDTPMSPNDSDRECGGTYEWDRSTKI